MKCIKCGSSNLTFESSGKQGFGAKKALAGVVLLGPLGLFAGAINKNKQNKAIAVCQDCGNIRSTEPTTAEKRTQQQLKNEQWKQDHPILWKTTKMFFMAVILLSISCILLVQCATQDKNHKQPNHKQIKYNN
jgi:hypothetical protein